MSWPGGELELSGTIGQPDAEVMEGSGFASSGGFWFTEPRSDCNSDGRGILIDYDGIEDSLSGPNGELLLPDCSCFDLDKDNDVDLSDNRGFQLSSMGEWVRGIRAQD
jgi:hypothetical protein